MGVLAVVGAGSIGIWGGGDKRALAESEGEEAQSEDEGMK